MSPRSVQQVWGLVIVKAKTYNTHCFPNSPVTHQPYVEEVEVFPVICHTSRHYAFIIALLCFMLIIHCVMVFWWFRSCKLRCDCDALMAQMAFCLQGIKMDDGFFIMNKDSFFPPVAFVWEIFFACFHGQIHLFIIDVFKNITKLTSLFLFLHLICLLYTAMCSNIFSSEQTKYRAWCQLSFFLFQSESTHHHRSESIQQEHHPSLRQAVTQEWEYDLEYWGGRTVRHSNFIPFS